MHVMGCVATMIRARTGREVQCIDEERWRQHPQKTVENTGSVACGRTPRVWFQNAAGKERRVDRWNHGGGLLRIELDGGGRHNGKE